jgi:hypothetical protein
MGTYLFVIARKRKVEDDIREIMVYKTPTSKEYVYITAVRKAKMIVKNKLNLQAIVYLPFSS